MTVSIVQLERIEQQIRARDTVGAQIAADIIAKEIKRRKGVASRPRLSPGQRRERNRINSANYRKRQAEQRDS